MVHSGHKHDAIYGNSSWVSDWLQWGYDHSPPSELGNYNYFTYRRISRCGNKCLERDAYLEKLKNDNSPKARKAFNYYNRIKKAHTEFYREIKEKEEKERLIQSQLEKERLEKEIKNQSNELDSFYDFDKTVKEIDDDIQSLDSNEGIESIESIQSVDSVEGMNGNDSMSKQIPLEKITPVMLLLGAGIVVYLFGSGRFDKK